MSIHSNKQDFSTWLPKDFSLIKNALSLEPFESLMEGVLVVASYAIAAVVLPWILDLFLAPLGLVLILLGGIAMGYGLYQYFQEENKNNADLGNTHAFGRGVMLGLVGVLLSCASYVAPFFILGVGLYRTYKSFSPEQIDEASTIVGNLGLSLNKRLAQSRFF
jgi:hypothetical protein